jgi:ankyrin repeat protein
MASIHNAVRSGNLALLRRIIASGANLNTQSGGLTPLHVAAESGQTNIARSLINAGAKITARSSRSGMTPLHLAAARSRSNIIRALINAGANREAKNTRGFKPIDVINNNRTRNLLRKYARTNNVAPVNRSWKNFNNKDPISLNNKNTWKGNRAIEVNTNGRKTYFYPSNFNRWFGNAWKTMPPNSNNSIHPTKRHPLTRSIVKRKQVKLVKFTGPR